MAIVATFYTLMQSDITYTKPLLLPPGIMAEGQRRAPEWEIPATITLKLLVREVT